MTNPSLFNGDVSMTSAVGLPQVTKSVLACNLSLSPSWVEGGRSAVGP